MTTSALWKGSRCVQAIRMPLPTERPLEKERQPKRMLCVLSRFSVQLFATPQTVARGAPLSMDFPGKDTGVGCHTLLQGTFPIQGLNLLHCTFGFFTTWVLRETPLREYYLVFTNKKSSKSGIQNPPESPQWILSVFRPISILRPRTPWLKESLCTL